jgi:uncharacterized iron-regulated membrane protein
MTRHRRKKPPARLLKSIYIWHRYIGLAAALFVILLSLTGLVLNHTEALSLDSRHVSTAYLLDWYGVRAPREMASFVTGPATITAVGKDVYWNIARIPQAATPLVGAVEFAGLVVVGIEGQLLLFTPEGELVERLDGAAGVPAGMQALGLTPDDALAIHAAHGYYRTDENFLEWHESENLDARWASASAPAPALKSALQQVWRGTGLTLERVLLDIHSGRILGGWGVYLMDAAALLFLLLAFTGVWLWTRRRASARAHRRSQRPG